MQGTPPPSPSGVEQTDEWAGFRRPNRPAAWAAFLGLAANAAWLIYHCSGQLTFFREERYVPAMLVQSLLLTLCCLGTSIAAICLGILGLRFARLPATVGRGRAIAGIAMGSLGLLWVLVMLVQMADIAIPVKVLGPKSVNRLQCAEHLRAIGKACEQYASKNDGRFPDEFIKLHTECGLDTNTLFCGSRRYPRMVTIEEVIEVTDWDLNGAYVYAGAGLSTGVAPDTVLVYERLENHEWGIHVLYADGRVEWLKEERAKQLIAAMQPKPPTSGPATQPVATAPAIKLADLNTQALLARQLHHYTISRINPRDVQFWVAQLENTARFPGDDWSPELKVRDVAVACLVEMAGIDFTMVIGKLNPRECEIVSFRDPQDELFRYHVSVLKDDDMNSVDVAVRCWSAGYAQGVRGRAASARPADQQDIWRLEP